jgi:hypothetical protein
MENNDLLDTKWIDNFEKIDSSYNMFYLDDVIYIKVTCIYINKKNEINKIQQENRLLNIPNCLSREEFISIFKKYSKKTYSIFSILKYNFDVDPTDINSFLKNKTDNSKFINKINHLNDITWNKTISMFQDINELFLFFREKNNTSNNTTKKIYIRNKNIGR